MAAFWLCIRMLTGVLIYIKTLPPQRFMLKNLAQKLRLQRM